MPRQLAIVTAKADVAKAAQGEGFDGELAGLYLVPEAQGSGLADALFDRGVEWLRARGHRSMGLWVLKENARARRFYERHGFKDDGGRKQCETLLAPAVRYRKALP